MTHISPAVTLVWAILSTMLGSFLVFHLWSFDRFNCLKWDHGPYAGAFKRVMTYSYLLSVPLIMIYAIGFSIIKYTYGYTIVPGYGVMPTPYDLWSNRAQSAIFPLYLCFSVAWGLEMVTHLEELCFWLFLVQSNASHQDWFRSLYFKIWAVGSCIAMLAMPLITIVTRHSVYKCEAFTFLAGGLGDLLLTLWFLPVLWVFPSFLATLKELEVETHTLVRLTQFHELNCIRVVFRFLFTIPFVILGVDGVRPHQAINDKTFPTDFLSAVAGIGCVVSSGLTLVVFFPRSLRNEMTRRQGRRAQGWADAVPGEGDGRSYASVIQGHGKSEVELGTSVSTHTLGMAEGSSHGLPPYDVAMATKKTLGDGVLQPNRRHATGEVELGGVLSVDEVVMRRATTQRERGTRRSGVSELVYHWRSPIEIARPGLGWDSVH